MSCNGHVTDIVCYGAVVVIAYTDMRMGEDWNREYTHRSRTVKKYEKSIQT